MRALEILVVGSLLLAPLLILSESMRRRAAPSVVAVLAAVLALAQWALEGYRWSMTGLYGLAAVWLVLGIVGLGRRRGTRGARSGRRGLRVAAAVAGAIIVLLAAAPAWLFPVFALPEPTGPAQVGTLWDAFVPAPPTGSDVPPWYLRREVSLQVWYPAGDGGDPVPYMRPEAARATALAWNAPPFILQHFTLVPTHSRAGAPVADPAASYPVVLFALSGMMTGCTALAEDLASHGYVVAAIGYRDARWSPFVFDGEGRAVAQDPGDERSIALSRELESDAVEGVKGRILQAAEMERKAALARELAEVQPLNSADVRLCAFEAGAALDRLATLSRGDGPLAGRLDPDRVAILGFSKGGAVAGQACLRDPRFRAGINMDGFMYPDVAELPLKRPFFFLHSENEHHPDALINDLFFRRAAEDSLMIRVRGSRHGSFGDPALWYLQRRGPGPIDGSRMIAILRAYVRAFLDRQLRGLDSDLLAGPEAEYPEVEVWTKDEDGRAATS